jgi:hypothetical protein
VVAFCIKDMEKIMKTFFLPVVKTALILAMTGCAGRSGGDLALGFANGEANGSMSPPKKTMRAFRSEQELRDYLRTLAKMQRRAKGAALAGAPLAMEAESKDASGPVAGAQDKESVTNVQHAGVDEGGIVKLHGDHLVVLRRGRLFTIAIGDGSLKPISSVDAFGPDIDPRSTWYDEMLVSDDTVAVIGYSYERGGTEVGLFQIDAAGNLAYRSTYHLRSNDYYSSRNYASRLIGTKLIFYTPLYVGSAENVVESFPAVRKWHKGATNDEFRRIVSASQVYRPERPMSLDYGAALHTVTICDLAGGGFDCKATSVVGPPGRVFYVSPEAVYVWVTEWVAQKEKTHNESTLYRMPLDGSGPSAIGVSGSPVDQFSFLEGEDGYLNVLVRSDAPGDGMWGAEVAAGDVALMRVPVASFSDGSQNVPSSRYRKLPKPEGNSYAFQNRFVGDYVLYGMGSGWGYAKKGAQANLYAVPLEGGGPFALPLSHGVDRIEQMGPDAVVVGTDGADLHFTAVRLGNSPEVADEYIRQRASQGELRSQGFFYKADGKDSGILGLPISTPARPGYYHLFQSSAAILFLRNDALHLHEIGELASQPERAKDDGCRASCVDWYGNARPLFVRGRVLALLGYELVEGAVNDGHMEEIGRISYAPQNTKPLARLNDN